VSEIIELSQARINTYVTRIKGAWQKGVESILETGRLLVEAKRELPGGFLAMIECDLPFGWSTAERLMKIAEHPVLGDSAHAPNLPPSWMTLYELTKLAPDELRTKLAAGAIHPSVDRRTVTLMLQKQRAGEGNDDAEAEGAPPTNGVRIPVPPGMTLESMCRQVMQLEADGVSRTEARKRFGLGERGYREAMTIVQLADRDDLGERDADLVRKVLAEMNSTQRTHRGFMKVKEIADRVWGRKSERGDRSRQKRIEEFHHATTIAAETCQRVSEINIPPLSNEEVEDALKQIREASAALRRLIARIERSRT